MCTVKGAATIGFRFPRHPCLHSCPRFCVQIQKLHAELQRKEREIAMITRSRNDLERRWGSMESQMAKEKDGVVHSSDTGAMLSALVVSANAGPSFAKDLTEFIELEKEKHRYALMRAKMQEASPWAKASRTDQNTADAVLRKIREAVYRKGSKIRDVFRLLDEDHSGDLSYSEFRAGLDHVGAPLTDAEFKSLLQVGGPPVPTHAVNVGFYFDVSYAFAACRQQWQRIDRVH